MKRPLSCFLVLTMLVSFAVLPCVVNAQSPTIRIHVNYQPTTLVYPPLLQNERTLVSVEDICNIFCAGSAYVNEYSMQILTKNGTALLIPETKNWLYQYKNDASDLENQLSSLPGIPMNMYDFDVPTYRKDGVLYLPLRAVSQALANGIDIVWTDEEFKVDLVWWSDGFEPNPSNQPSADKIAEAMRNLSTSGNALRYNQTTPELLIELGIAKKEDFEGGTYLTTLEALHLLDGKYDPENGTSNVPSSYNADFYASLAPMDESTKRLLMVLSTPFDRCMILTTEEIPNLQFDEYITEYEALIYITRTLGSTYGCSDRANELYYTEKSETYQTAYHMGLIPDANTENADAPITREAFLSMLHKSLFVEYRRGSYGGVFVHRLVDHYNAKKW